MSLRSGSPTVKDMKAPFTTALSMGAILATGGAALAVNASVLDPQVEVASPSTEVTAPATVSPSTVPSFVPNEFQIPGIGLVTMSTVDGVLTLDNVTANTGISYTVTETAPGEYEIKFETADQVVTFTARLVDGQIVTSATGMSTEPPATQPAPSPAPSGSSGGSSAGSSSGSSGGGVSYEDDDDGFEYEDHDDDHDFEYEDDGFEFEGGDDD
ncbi:MAG: hypothetical protein RLZ37_1544 [Actinomycetota bacterium]